jgi:hypothetical protein
MPQRIVLDGDLIEQRVDEEPEGRGSFELAI